MRIQRWTISGLLALVCLAGATAQPALAVRTNNLSAEVMYERGARAMRAGDTEASLEYLERASQLDPRSLAILSLYGRALLIAGKPAEAMAQFDRYASINPNSTELDYYRGIASYQLGNWPNTIRYLLPEVEKRPQEGMIRLYLGVAYQETERPKEAREMLEAAARVDPTLRAAALYRIGVMALEQKNTEDARTYLEEVEQIAAGSALARSARNYLDQIDTGLYRPIAAYATFMGGYDSNVSLDTGEGFYLGDEVGSGVGSGLFGLSGMLIDTERFDLRVGADGFVNIHGSNPANDYDQAAVTGFALSSLEITEWMRFNLSYNYEFIWLNYEKFLSTNEIEGGLRFIPYGDFVTSVFYGVSIREFLLRIPPGLQELNRDGTVQKATFTQLWYTPNWFGWGKNFLSANFAYRHEVTEGTEFDNNAYYPFARVGFALPWQMYWTATAGYEWRKFKHASCFYDYNPTPPPGRRVCAKLPPRPPSGQHNYGPYPKRQDKIVRVFSNLRIGISRELFLDLRYSFTKRYSNVDFYRYDRNLAEFGVTYRY